MFNRNDRVKVIGNGKIGIIQKTRGYATTTESVVVECEVYFSEENKVEWFASDQLQLVE